MKIQLASREDAEWLQSEFAQHMPWSKRAGYFRECCDKQERELLTLLYAAEDGGYLGHVKVVWQAEYAYFRDAGIPLIQDLNVIPTYRRRGIATQLMDEAEALIGRRSNAAGIGVGLYADYGPAQRMYVLRGYVPDGQGISYKDRPLNPGEHTVLDDDLVLFLVKQLN